MSRRVFAEKIAITLTVFLFFVSLCIGATMLIRAQKVDIAHTSELLFSASRTINDFDRLRLAARRTILRDPDLNINSFDRAFEMSRSRMKNFKKGELAANSDDRVRSYVARINKSFSRMEADVADINCDMICKAEKVLPNIAKIKRELTKLQGRALSIDAAMRRKMHNLHHDAILKIFIVSAIFSLFAGGLMTLLVRKNHTLNTQANELRQSQARISEVSEYRGQFLAGMSHEFRTPLNAIKGFSQLMQLMDATLTASKRQEYLADIEKSANDLEKLTDTVLDLSKIDAGALVMREEYVSFSELVADVKRQFEVAEGGVTNQISVVAPPDMALFCDRFAMKRCLQNIISNAIKFSKAGSPVKLCASVEQQAVTIVVEDQGCGIPEEELDAVWEVYARSSLTRVSDLQGTGLGLPMVKALIEAHDGSIGLRSTLGHGTSVAISLPLSRLRIDKQDAA